MRGGADCAVTIGLVLNARLGVCEEDIRKGCQVIEMWGMDGEITACRERMLEPANEQGQDG